MDVGLLSLGDLITDPVTGTRRTHAQRHRNLVELSSPPVVLAAIAERTTTLRLSTGVALGVNLDPIRIAEDYATVDVLSGGRVEPCIGRGTFFPHTFEVFGQESSNAGAVFAENLEILVEVWEREDVSWSGIHHSPLRNVTVNPRPVQTPRPPIWAGVGASPESIDLAARLGLWIMLPTVFGTIDMFRKAVDLYEARWEHYGHPASAKRIGCCTHTYIHESSQRARQVWEPRYRAYIEWVNALQSASSGGKMSGLGLFDFEALTGRMAMCGSPEEVIDRMGSMRDKLHLDTQILMFDMGGLPDTELFDVIELAGKSVLPQCAAF
jgi:alkanesulfonate monooxygenase SsuD/methylene tetrahydromethanopterin reductase-like flavin-dependent oxidoreductase (luciferase family)